MSKIFKSPSGVWITMGLFIETAQQSDYLMYTLKEEDHELRGQTWPSLKKLYMSYEHVPGAEYDFANDHLGGWTHWTAIVNHPTLSKHVEEWREELEVKLRASAVKEVIHQSRSDKGYQAAKWLAEGGYAPKKAGRPSKEQVEKEARIQAGLDSHVDDMMKRIQ